MHYYTGNPSKLYICVVWSPKNYQPLFFSTVFCLKINQATSRFAVLRRAHVIGRLVWDGWMFVQVLGGWCSSRLPQKWLKLPPINFPKNIYKSQMYTKEKGWNNLYLLCLETSFFYMFKKNAFKDNKQSLEGCWLWSSGECFSKVAFQESAVFQLTNVRFPEEFEQQNRWV